MQPAHGGRVVWFDDTSETGISIWRSAHRLDVARPVGLFQRLVPKGGPQNYSQWWDNEFDDLLAQIDTEVDPAKRLALIRKTEDDLRGGSRCAGVVGEINDVWYAYVKGHNPNEYFDSTTSSTSTPFGWTRELSSPVFGGEDFFRGQIDGAAIHGPLPPRACCSLRAR